MTHASLFSGIGGFDLAAEWAGWANVFNCEIAKIWLIYKRKEDGGFAEMYLLFMPHEKGTVYDINKLSEMTYEDIRLDRTALLRK